MPQIIVTAGDAALDDKVTLRERVNASDFESERFAANLVERLGWAVLDAVQAERDRTEEPHAPTEERRRQITGQRPRNVKRDSHLEPVGA